MRLHRWRATCHAATAQSSPRPLEASSTRQAHEQARPRANLLQALLRRAWTQRTQLRARRARPPVLHGWPCGLALSPPDHRLPALAAFGCLCGGLSTADALDAPASLRGHLRRQARSHVRHLRSFLASSPVRVQWIAKLSARDGRSRLRVLVELRLAGVSGHDKGRSLGPVYGTDLGTNLGANLGANLGVVGLIRPANGGETSPTPHRPAWGLRNMGMPPLQRR